MERITNNERYHILLERDKVCCVIYYILKYPILDFYAPYNTRHIGFYFNN